MKLKEVIMMFKDLNIIIGITGGIAAYKACDLVSYFKKEGANVDVIMTKNACEFITPLTLETLSGNKVITDMFERPDYIDVKHISLARKADLFLIVPATANIIGKVANGIADDMLSTTIMATKAPVIFAPAMNNGMYENPIVQNNLEKLRSYGYKIIEPSIGHLACGYEAKGKLPKSEEIIDYVKVLVKERK
jgi:phosphopantothenoylcysteine decarboxylase/phosphopantothenate--cysteine ligase